MNKKDIEKKIRSLNRIIKIKYVIDFILNIPANIVRYSYLILVIVTVGMCYIVGGMNSHGDIEINPIIGIERIIRRLSMYGRPGELIFLLIAFIVVVFFLRKQTYGMAEVLSIDWMTRSISKDRTKIMELENALYQ